MLISMGFAKAFVRMGGEMSKFLCVVVVLLFIAFSGRRVMAAGDTVIEIQPRDFVTSYLLTDKEIQETRKSNSVRGFGEVTYTFQTATDGWWEFWAQGGNSPIDLIVDGQRIIHAQIESGVWEPEGNLKKMLNLWLSAGEHELCISRPQPWGIPWIRRMQLRSARDMSGKVRTSLMTDALVRRKGESLPIKMFFGKGEQAGGVRIAVTREHGKEPVWTREVQVPAGEGNMETTLELPAQWEGTFEATFTDGQGAPVDRTIQYLIVDVETRPAQDQQPNRELVQEIDCTVDEPDYASGKTEVVHASLGAYRETGPKGRTGYNLNADWFAYTITVPTLHEPYLAEIEYPDNDERVAIISMIDRLPNPYAPTLGYASGGIYSLSGKMLKQNLYFYPREKDMRLFIQTWQTGPKAAMGKVRIYRLSSMPKAMDLPNRGRYFGGYQEENIRFTSYYGGVPKDGNTWRNYFNAACRYAQNQRHIGGNFWQQTIGNYQQALWPQKTIFGYGVVDSTGWELQGGPILPVHPEPLDMVRMQLLVCEKFGLNFLGELLLPPNRNFKKHMDKQFGGKGTLDDNGPHKPWLLYSNKGEHFDNSNSGKGYWNPLYPGVQDWTASVIEEIAQRYKDSPAFNGVAIRLAAWCFSSWQCFPSIEFGYEDFTIALFEKETRIKIPVSPTDPKRCEKRYEWLMANAYEQWVDWRCQKIYAYHSRLVKIMTDARPDLKLYLHILGPDFSRGYEYADELRNKTWEQMIRGSGIDVDLYNANPALVLQDVPTYPSSKSRAKTQIQAASQRECNWNLGQYTATRSKRGNGTVGAMMFSSDSFEGEMVDAKAIGFKNFSHHNKTTIHGAGEVNPAGIHYLDRFAEAMAHSNVVVMSSGNHGYDQQQSQYISPFLLEYRHLPAMGMTPLQQDADPVSVWQGADKGKMYFYAVNRLDQQVLVTLEMTGDAKPMRLTTGEVLVVKKNQLTFELEPYQLLGFTGGVDTVKVASIQTTVPEAVKKALQQQIDFSMNLLNTGGQQQKVISLSPVQFREGFQALRQAQAALQAGKVVTARRQLLVLSMTRIYEAYGAYPPGLYHKKSPAQPIKAMSATDLRNMTLPASTPTQVIPGEKIDTALSGRDAFTWYASDVTLEFASNVSNRFEFDLVCATTPDFKEPQIHFNGKALTADTFYREQGAAWTRLISKQPLALAQGANQFVLKKNKNAQVAVLYMNLHPASRDLIASDWRVLGPFPGADDPRQVKVLHQMMDIVYPPEKNLNFKATCVGLNNKTLSWQQPAFDTDFVDLYRVTGELMFKVSYAACMIEAPTTRDAQLIFGVDYWAQIWLNGQEIFNNVGAHNAAPFKGEYKIPVKLNVGKNEVLVKVHAGSSGNGFWMSISDLGDLKILTAKAGSA